MATTAIEKAGDLLGKQGEAYGTEKVNDENRKREMEMQGRQIESTKEMHGDRKKAYEEAKAMGGQQMSLGEEAFYSGINAVNPELAAMSKDIDTKTAQMLGKGATQMGANLATQGVRGGQASTLLNRGTGEMAQDAQMDINKMKFADAEQKAREERAFASAKAQAGQRASLLGTGDLS